MTSFMDNLLAALAGSPCYLGYVVHRAWVGVVDAVMWIEI